jgi:DNA-binding NarL/FixJ family response regulator
VVIRFAWHHAYRCCSTQGNVCHASVEISSAALWLQLDLQPKKIVADVIFIGIIEQNTQIVHEIVQFFLQSERYSLLFACTSMEEFKALPEAKKNKARMIFFRSSEGALDRIWEIKYLRQVNPNGLIFLLLDLNVKEYQFIQLRKNGVESIISTRNITHALEGHFAKQACLSQHINKQPVVASFENAIVAGKSIALTARELEIVALVLKGHTNKKISQCMFISVYTVNAHLRKIFSKLSVKSRTAMMSKIIDEIVD